MREADLVVLCLPDERPRKLWLWWSRWAAMRPRSSMPAPRIGSRRLGLRVPRDGCGPGEALREANRVSNPGCYPTARMR